MTHSISDVEEEEESKTIEGQMQPPHLRKSGNMSLVNYATKMLLPVMASWLYLISSLPSKSLPSMIKILYKSVCAKLNFQVKPQHLTLPLSRAFVNHINILFYLRIYVWCRMYLCLPCMLTLCLSSA